MSCCVEFAVCTAAYGRPKLIWKDIIHVTLYVCVERSPNDREGGRVQFKDCLIKYVINLIEINLLGQQ